MVNTVRFHWYIPLHVDMILHIMYNYNTLSLKHHLFILKTSLGDLIVKQFITISGHFIIRLNLFKFMYIIIYIWFSEWCKCYQWTWKCFPFISLAKSQELSKQHSYSFELILAIWFRIIYVLLVSWLENVFFSVVVIRQKGRSQILTLWTLNNNLYFWW